MFFKLFDWLIKKGIPYTPAFVLLCFTWAVLVAVFGALLVLVGADFEATGTQDVFLLVYFGGVGTASVLIMVEYGIFRLFGFRWEREEFKALNDNMVDGHIRRDISDEELSQAYYALSNLTKWKEVRDITYGQITVVGATLAEWLLSGQLTNVPIIFIGSNIATLSLYTYAAVFHDTITSPARRECKMLLAGRGLHFEESPLLSLRTKSKFFIVFIGLALLAILLLIKPLNPLIVVLAIITLVITCLLNDMVSKSIYTEFAEIMESAKNLAEGKKAFFFTGSSDREMFDLTHSLDETAQDIMDYQRALRGRITELEEYMSIASHDLQQPLATIQAYTQLLKASELSGGVVEKTEVIESQADFMRELLNDLLEYSRTKRKMPLEEVNVLEVLEGVKKSLALEIREKGAVIRFKNIPPSIFGQGKRITQLFRNLIGNALKYADKKPAVEVGCEDRGKEFLFWVRDNGRGIGKQYHKKIFQPFWKLGKEPGTGMGLAICKAIIENHKGKIWVESRPGEGTSFKFTIPKGT
jgi:signal transduction histidine kinase